MATHPPSPKTLNNLIFWAGEKTVEEDDEEIDERHWLHWQSTALKTEDGDLAEERKKSMYVTLFDDMLHVVCRHEQFLFSDAEVRCFNKYDNFSYGAKYLFVRLCLRKPDKWHRLQSLKYESELGAHGLVDALRELCGVDSGMGVHTMNEQDMHQKAAAERRESNIILGPSNKRRRGAHHVEIIDLTGDISEAEQEKGSSALNSLSFSLPVNIEETIPCHAGPSKPLANVNEVGCEDGLSELSTFAEDASQAPLRDLLDCLTSEELRHLAKQMKLKATMNRASLLSTLLSSASTQATLTFPVLSHSKNKDKARTVESLHQVQLPLSFGSKMRKQTERLRTMVMKVLVNCIRINADVFKLFKRLNLVFFRSTQHTLKLLIPSLLSRANKRAYPKYDYIRTTDVWRSREALLEFERALELEAQVDSIIEGTSNSSARDKKRSNKVPAPKAEHSSMKTQNVFNVPKRGNVATDEARDGASTENSARIQDAHLVKGIFERVYQQWKDLVTVKKDEGERRCGLERFDCGHVLTRVVCKGAYALGVLKEHRYELEVLDALLAQRRWRRGRRGGWHNRRALILMTHLEQDEKTSIRALNAVIEGLEDFDTHIIYRPMLQRRLTRLEKRLKLPVSVRHKCQGKLQKSKEVVIKGVRVRHRAASIVLDAVGRVVQATPRNNSTNTSTSPSNRGFPAQPIESQIGSDVKPKWTGKSIWIGSDDEEVSVEVLALQHYQTRCYKGLHSEGRIVCTLFGLLFWDILFTSIPGAFETAYQSAPLDIVDDSFYLARREIIEKRLSEIENGEARRIVELVHREHRERETLCVGVQWDLVDREELLEITDCISGKSLSAICRTFCEDYAARGAGLPDLFIWNHKKRRCKFVEVKGPGDTLQENQKVWIDILLQADVPVEVCRVEECDQSNVEPGNGTKRKRSVRTRKGKNDAIGSDSEEEEWQPESEDDMESPRATSDVGQVPQTRSQSWVPDRVEVVMQSPQKRRYLVQPDKS